MFCVNERSNESWLKFPYVYLLLIKVCWFWRVAPVKRHLSILYYVSKHLSSTEQKDTVLCIPSRNIWVYKVYWGSLGKAAMRNEGCRIWSKGKVQLWWGHKKRTILSWAVSPSELRKRGQAFSCDSAAVRDSLGQGSFLWLRQVPGRGLAFSWSQLGACVTQSWKEKSVQGTTVPTTVIPLHWVVHLFYIRSSSHWGQLVRIYLVSFHAQTLRNVCETNCSPWVGLRAVMGNHHLPPLPLFSVPLVLN